MNNIFTPSLPEQVAQNTIAIEQLRQIFNNASADIDMQDNTTVISATHITPTLSEGFILDTVGHLYKIVSYDEDTQLYTVRFLTDLTTTGPQGPQGVGIASIALTSSAGLVDTYTITYTDSTTSTFTVTNGAQGPTGNGISTIALTSSAGLIDTYTITFTDGTTTTFTVTNGAQGNPGPTGNGISSITKTGTSGNVDTYTISYTNGTTSTFTITNGTFSLLSQEFTTMSDLYTFLFTNFDNIRYITIHTTGAIPTANFARFNSSNGSFSTTSGTTNPSGIDKKYYPKYKNSGKFNFISDIEELRFNYDGWYGFDYIKYYILGETNSPVTLDFMLERITITSNVDKVKVFYIG